MQNIRKTCIMCDVWTLPPQTLTLIQYQHLCRPLCPSNLALCWKCPSEYPPVHLPPEAANNISENVSKYGLAKISHVIWVFRMSAITDLGSRSFFLFNFVLFFKRTTFPHGDPIFHQAVVKVFPWNAKDGTYVNGIAKAGALAENGWQNGLDRCNGLSLHWHETLEEWKISMGFICIIRVDTL